MALYHDIRGHGPELVMLHGWGLHGGIWGELPQQLAKTWRVTTLDLPGHGRSAAIASTLDAFTDRVAELGDTPAVWFGWSLGALVALNAAFRHPARVAGLVLVGATPRFVQAEDWASAMSRDVFAQFGASLGEDYRATLLRFLSLQVGGDADGRVLIKRLRAEMFAHGEPQPEALAAGLAILEHTDLRMRLPEIRVPTLVLHGGHDRLAPPAAGEYLATHIPGARYVCMSGAGHAPFLSRPAAFLDALREFHA